MTTGRKALAVKHGTLLVEAQSALGKPAYGQWVTLMFLSVHALRQCLWRIVRGDRHYGLYDTVVAIDGAG